MTMPSEVSPNVIKVAVVEDRKDIREGLEFLLNSTPGLMCVAACSDSTTALAEIPEKGPAVILLDIDLGEERTGLDLIQPLKHALPATKVVMLTALEEDELVFRALCRGADGYLRRATLSKRLTASISGVLDDRYPLSPGVAERIWRVFKNPPPDPEEFDKLSDREAEIIQLLAQGYEAKEIAQQLGTSYETVKTQVRNIRNKLEVRTREQAVKKVFPTKKFEAVVRQVPGRQTV